MFGQDMIPPHISKGLSRKMSCRGPRSCGQTLDQSGCCMILRPFKREDMVRTALDAKLIQILCIRFPLRCAFGKWTAMNAVLLYKP